MTDQISVAERAQQLLHPERIWTAAQIVDNKPCPVPKEPGVYGWYFHAIPPRVPVEDCHIADGMALLYVGISPRKPSANGKTVSANRLYQRIRIHLRGPARRSTFRVTLGCLLADELGITLQRVGDGHRMLARPPLSKGRLR